MPDNKNKRRPQDSSRINSSEGYEVDYWSKKFGVTKERLKEVVKRIGNSVSKVKNELGK